MTSRAKAAANRANAARSTGPRTAAGRRRSALNALKHGLTSSRCVLPAEDRSAHERLRADLHARLQPEGGAAPRPPRLSRLGREAQDDWMLAQDLAPAPAAPQPDPLDEVEHPLRAETARLDAETPAGSAS